MAKPDQSQFKVQVRLAQAKFDCAETLDAIQAEHAKFIETFNTTPHWAHHEREDGRQTPVEVLGWVRGRMVDPKSLRSILRHVQFERAVDRTGYISVQRFYIYAERGLARQRVSVWLYEGRLHIEYQQTMLARYAYRYDRKRKQLQGVDQPQLQKTVFADPQMELWELDDEQWRKVLGRAARPQHSKSARMSTVERLSFRIAGLMLLLAAEHAG